MGYATRPRRRCGRAAPALVRAAVDADGELAAALSAAALWRYAADASRPEGVVGRDADGVRVGAARGGGNGPAGGHGPTRRHDRRAYRLPFRPEFLATRAGGSGEAAHTRAPGRLLVRVRNVR